jgi:hypothetical protein
LGSVLGKFTFGYIVSVGIAAVIFILAVQFVGKKWPHVPVVGAVARGLRGGA